MVRIEEGDGWKIVWCACEGEVAGRVQSLGCFCPEHGLPALEDKSIDHVICDPPYSARTHDGQKFGRYKRKQKTDAPATWLSDQGLVYDHIDDQHVDAFVEQAVRVTKSWTLAMTSHDLFPSWESSLEELGHYVFAPIPIVIPGMSVRLQGDGPSNWTVWLVVARPRIAKKWGTKRGAYVGYTGADPKFSRHVKGAKSVELMSAIVADYSKRGETICDPFLGSGSTGVAAVRSGRHFLGFELAEKNFEVSLENLRRTRFQKSMFDEQPAIVAKGQEELLVSGIPIGDTP